MTGDEQALNAAQQALLTQTAGLQKLERLRGWTVDAIRALGLGLDRDRILIPVHDETGSLCGLLRYAPDPSKRGDAPKMLAAPGSIRGLFPAPESLPTDAVIWLVEGEADAVAAHSIGLSATAVPGTSSWSTEWAARFDGRHVVICADCDGVGRGLAERAADDIVSAAESVRIVDLAPARDDGYDLSDLVIAAAGDRDQARDLLQRVADNAPLHIPVEDRPPRPRLTVTQYRQALRDYFESDSTDTAWPTPWTEINDAADGGIRPGELWVLAGWTSNGKSVAADQIADSAQEAGATVHLYLTEMSIVQRGLRTIARHTGIPFKLLRRRQLTAEQYNRAVDATGRLPYAVSVVTDWTPQQVATDIRASRTNLAIIDLLHGFDYQDERELSAIVSEFARAATSDTSGRGNGTAVLLLCQLNESQMQNTSAAKRPKPGMRSLKGSSWIKQLADIVMFTWLEDDSDGVPTDEGEIWIAKNRNGGKGGLSVRLDPARLAFVPIGARS